MRLFLILTASAIFSQSVSEQVLAQPAEPNALIAAQDGRMTEAVLSRREPNQADRGQSRRSGGRMGFDFSQMSPEQRQEAMERARRFAGQFMGGPAEGGPAASDPNKPMESLNLNNVEMRNVVQMLGDWTGKVVIPVNDEIMNIKVTLYSPVKLPRTQALGLLLLALQERGVAADISGDKILLRPLLSAKQGAIPVLGTDEPLERMSDRSAIVEKWFQLSHYKAGKLVELIKPLTAEYGHTMADEVSGRVAVIDTVDNLLRIQKIIREIDIPESAQQVEQVFEVRFGNPEDMVGILELILGQGAPSVRPSPSAPARPEQRGGQSSGGGGKVEKAASSVVIEGTTVPIRLIPVPKRRWIIVRAAKEDMERIGKWIERLDQAQAEDAQQSVVPLRYADVREVVSIVQSALQEMPTTGLKTSVMVEGLTESRQIVIIGSEENRVMVERMVAQLDLPSGDYFTEKTFKLKHADPDQIKKNIDDLYGETTTSRYDPYAYRFGSGSRQKPEDTVKVISYPTLKQVTVIASEKNMEKIIRQIEDEWDKPLDIERDQYRILSLQNSDPVQMAELLGKLFSEEQESNRMPWWWYGSETDDTKKKIVGSLYGVLTFEPVPDTKKIIVISKIPEAYEVIEEMVRRLDSREKAEVPRVVTLKYADSEDLCEQLNAILNEAGTVATIQRSQSGLSANNTEQQATQGASTDAGVESAGTIKPWWTSQQQSKDQLPSSNLIGRVRFVPVHRSKAMLVLSPPEYMEDMIMMIEDLDRPGMQVMVKVVIMEVNLQDTTSLGVRLSSDPSAFGTIGVDSVNFLNELQNVERSSGAAERSGSSSLVSGTKLATSANINALVDLLVKKADGRVLNQPTLWTKDNEEAVFIKGQKVAFIESDQTDRTNLNAVNRTFTYEDVGVTLRVRPNITPEKAVDMTINLNISQVEKDLINTQVARKNLDTTTHLIVNDGQTILMGGILFQNDEKLVQKIPLLGDIPVLGVLFSHTGTTLSNSELLVFVTPYVVDERALSGMPVKSEQQRREAIKGPGERMESALENLSGRMSARWADPNNL